MNTVFILILIAAFVVFLYVAGKIREKQKKKAFRQKLIDDLGKLPELNYTQADFDRIRKFHDLKSEEAPDQDRFRVDEITWNDLNMNDVFLLFDATLSSAGEEYLYHKMHTMDLAEDPGFTDLTDAFYREDDFRLQMQMILGELSKIRHFSVAEVLFRIRDVESEKNLRHIIADLCLLASIGLIFVRPGIGVLLLIVCLSYNVFTYYRRKGEISPYYTTLFYVIRMLHAADEIHKNGKIPKQDQERLRSVLSDCRSYKRNIFILGNGVMLSESIMDILLEYIRIIFHLDIIKFNSMLHFLQKDLDKILTLFEMLGKYDAAIAVALSMHAMKGLNRPEFIEEKTVMIEDVFHPLIKEPVANSITASSGVLITGSNASGKSTFIKSVALCALLSQTLYVVPARSYRACRFRLMTSMALNDQILSGESYFIVEIKSLKRIVDLADTNGAPVLCVVDEVLRGTNTIERIAASARILYGLEQKNALCFVATHDIELTKILKKSYTDYHFEEEIADGDVNFSYVLKEGRSNTHNAIRLLSVIGFDENVIEEATKAAEHFRQTNKWEMIE
ncbi:MAG: hypothetical protein J5518_07465 [Lachnospiraceae bacterium]|nr:hypothetical protein [Lachnospiraceae bacterium]